MAPVVSNFLIFFSEVPLNSRRRLHPPQVCPQLACAVEARVLVAPFGGLGQGSPLFVDKYRKLGWLQGAAGEGGGMVHLPLLC